LDSIRLSDPFILADKKTKMYYMTGTGGMLWKSSDLRRWTGPFKVVQQDTTSWMGKNSNIWAAEIHLYNGKYYYFGTFTNRDVKIDTVKGNAIDRRACHILVNDKPDGPYVPFGDKTYLPADMPTLDATLWIEDGQPYMLYCYEWLQNWNGTVEAIKLKPGLDGTIGKRKVLFFASESPWSKEKMGDNIIPNKVTDGPYVFRTQTGRLGMIWTSWVYDVYTQGVAYSDNGKLHGKWVHEKEPITPPNFGHGMLFRNLDGKLLMCIHSHKEVNGRYMRFPHLFEVDDSGDKIIIGKAYK
jgi:GH43 family beta-xylosidase